MHRTLLALWFVACAPQTSPGDPEPAPVQPNPMQPARSEPEVLGLMQAHDGLTLQLRSGGCRDKGDVGFDVDGDTLEITKLEPDACEANMPLGEMVQFLWSELPTFAALGFAPGVAHVLEPGTTAGATTAPEGAMDESIFGVLVTADGLDVRVFSGGCTGPADFTTWIEPGAVELVHLVRTRLDGCEAEIPEGVLLHFTWAQLGVTKPEARLVNPIYKLPSA